MKYLLVTLNGFGEILKEKKGERSLYEFARKENLEKIAKKGTWGHVLLGKTQEKSYFSFFGFPNKEFPGESYLRCLENEIEIENNRSIFLGNFITHYHGKIVETKVNLSEKENFSLLTYLYEREKGFSFQVFKNGFVLIFRKKFPAFYFPYPVNLKNKNYRSFLPQDKEFKEIKDLIEASGKILENHIINKIRADLGESVANLLWLWGKGEKKPFISVMEKYNIKTYFFSFSNKLTGLAKFLDFEIKKDFSLERKEQTLLWVQISLPEEKNPSIWLKHFETFDKEILGRVIDRFEEGKYKILLIFDRFLNEELELLNHWAVFLKAGEENKKRFFQRRSYRKSSSLISDFLDKYHFLAL